MGQPPKANNTRDVTGPADPDSFLPLRPVELEVLLTLSAGEAHGYGIIKESEVRAGGLGRLETGTLYRALRRLTSDGLVEPTEGRPLQDADDERRTYYAITPLGRAVASAEARRLEAQVEAARAVDLLPRAEGAGGGR
jgi:DNA-binding PadR family transcriptional regulator